MYQRSTIRYTSSGEDMWTLESMQLGGHNIQDFSITRIISHSIVLYHKTISLCKRKITEDDGIKISCGTTEEQSDAKIGASSNLLKRCSLRQASVPRLLMAVQAGKAPLLGRSPHTELPPRERCRPAPRQSRSLTWKAAGTSARQTSVFLRRETLCLF